MCAPPALEPKPVVCAQSPVPPARWLTILRHRRCPNQRLFTVHTRARTAGAVAPHGADILSDARGSPGTGALNGTGAPGADARCPTRRRRHAHALSGPAARKHACSHIHTHSRGCAVSFQADLQARPVGRGPGSVPSGNRDRQGLCSSESSPSLPAGSTAPAGGEPES